MSLGNNCDIEAKHQCAPAPRSRKWIRETAPPRIHKQIVTIDTSDRSPRHRVEGPAQSADRFTGQNARSKGTDGQSGGLRLATSRSQEQDFSRCGRLAESLFSLGILTSSTGVPAPPGYKTTFRCEQSGKATIQVGPFTVLAGL